MTHFTFVFASIGDSVNSLRWNSSAGGDAPFSRMTGVITSGDATTDAAIRAAFVSAGVSDGVLNSDVISDTRALGTDPLGFGLGSATWSTLWRLALCDDSDECDQWMGAPQALLRVTPRAEVPHTTVAWPLTTERVRATGRNENSLNDTLNALIERVAAAWTNVSVLQSTAALAPLPLEGRTCIATLTNCLGDTRDAAYLDGDEPLRSSTPGIQPAGPSWVLTADPSDFLMVVGVLHNLVDPPMATYTNVATYDVAKSMGVTAMDNTKMAGSARPYFGFAGDADASDPIDMLYAIRVSRSCGPSEPYCLSVPTDPPTFPGIPLTAALTLVERAYVNPQTLVGPDPTELLPPTVLHFHK
jgi:hypothetical protein